MNKSIVAAILLVFIFACREEKKSQKTTEASKMGPLSVEALVVQPSSVSDVIEVAGNILPFEMYLQCFAIVSFSLTLFARNIHVR